MQHFVIDGRYRELLDVFSIDVAGVLTEAALPMDTFERSPVTMTEEGYYRFFGAIAAGRDASSLAVKLGSAVEVESFSPPLLAAISAPDGRAFLTRLARYKKLIGPMRFVVHAEKEAVRVEIGAAAQRLPPFLVACEYAFLVHALRHATDDDIVPLSARMQEAAAQDALGAYLQTPIKRGRENEIVFSAAALDLPFRTCHESMWLYLEPELERRRDELAVDGSTGARVRRALAELLPTGEASVEAVAEELSLSKRTLQRRLTEESTSFQKQLAGTREMLAVSYIKTTDMTANDIAYLLGYAEINSFLRAFSLWTGRSFSEYRKHAKGNR